MRFVMLLVLVLVSFAALADYQPRGKSTEFALEFQGTQRWVTVYQPAGYQTAAPVVLLLHGGTQSMRKLFRPNSGGTAQWLAIADREKCMLLIPNATNADTGDTRGDNQNWNDLRPADAKGQTTADDVGFLVQLLDWAQAKYSYDPTRVFVTGASNGGMMTMRLLIERPERFTAAAAFIASLPASGAPRPALVRRVPLMLLNGTADPLIQWRGGKILGGRGETMPIEANLQWWLELNGVAGAQPRQETLPDTDPEDGCRIYRSDWAAAAPGSASVVFYRVEGGGHSLPSSLHPVPNGPLLRRLIGPVCRDAEGAELAWRFFKAQAR